MSHLASAGVVVALVGIMALMVQPGLARGQETSLFTRLGGSDHLRAVVVETIDEASTDSRTQRSFDKIDLDNLKDSLYSQLCELSGGPCHYEGPTMVKAHRDLNIQPSEFDAMVDILRKALDRHVGTSEKNELLRRLAPMKRDVILQ